MSKSRILRKSEESDYGTMPANRSNTKLEELLQKHDAIFICDELTFDWSLAGPASGGGNGWETDDFEAQSWEEAESDAIAYLEDYHG